MPLFQAPPQQPPPRPLHWLYHILYTLGLIAGLWQHGQPYLTLVLVCAMPFFAFAAYLPNRWFGPAARSASQHLLGVCALFWIVYRVQMRTPVDLLLVEAFALMGAGFAFSTMGKSYGFVLLMSIMLIGYGALLPARLLFLVILLPSAVIFFVLMYNTRIPGLAEKYDIDFRDSVSRRNLRPILSHAVIAALILPVIASLFPQRGDGGHMGAAPVSYSPPQHENIAPALGNWFRSPNSRRSATATDTIDSEEDPTEISPDSTAMVPNLPGPPTMSQNGNGSGTPSDRLVMRVKSPVKLYWLAQLYNSYDGTTWSQSKGFDRNFASRRDYADNRLVIPQTVWIESWVSPALYSAFQQEAPISSPSSRVSTMKTWYGERLEPGQPYPTLPFRYNVRSSIANPDTTLPMMDDQGRPNRNRDRDWPERIAREQYLKLPHDITDRVRERALQVTHGLTTPREKAFALRDYLRNSFAYTLTPGPPPEGREAVDYLLFDLDAAHCQYFASALAVMGRINDLPTRVATGFSPGDYNTVTGLFEVREYHAHAWTQVYIEDIGWITMDGTPASADQLQLRNTPAFVGNFMPDPFSKDWQVTSPELSQDMVAYQQSFMEVTGMKEPKADPGNDAGDPLDAGDKSETNSSNGGQTSTPARRLADLDAGTIDTSIFGMITRNFTTVLLNLRDRILTLVTFFSPGQLLSLMVLCVSLMVLLARLPQIVAHWRIKRRLERLNRWYALAQASDERDPAHAVLHCYRSLRELLALAGMPRDPHHDLFAYGSYLRSIDKQLGADAAAVFTAYSQLRYSREPASPADARATLDHTASIRDRLLPTIQTKP